MKGYLDKRSDDPSLPMNKASIDYHQQRGAAWDIIDEAILAYDQWMLDDDYDAMPVLHGIMRKIKERSALYRALRAHTE